MTSSLPDAPATSDKINQLLSDLQGKYKKPDPANLFMQATRFEQIFNRLLAPFIGANIILLAGIILHRLYPGKAEIISAGNLAAAFIIMAVLYLYNKQHQWVPPIMISAATAAVLAAVLNLPYPLITPLLAIIIGYTFATLIYSGKFDQKATIVYGLYLPVLVYNLGPREPELRLVLDALVIIPTLILFIYGRLGIATFAMIVSAVVITIIEGSTLGSTALLTIILSCFVILIIYYEIRITKTGYSNLRNFFDQSMFLILTLIFFFSYFSWSTGSILSTWAAFIVVYQGLQYLRERCQSHTRLALAVIAVTIALWHPIPSDPNPLSFPFLTAVVGTMMLAALLHIAALYTENTFLSNVAILLLIPGAGAILSQSRNSFCLLLVMMGPLTAIELSLISGRPVFPAQLPWWSGFLQEDHVQWIKNATLMIIGPILTAPFISFFVNLFRTVFLWLRYFRGEETPFGLMDILFALANMYGATILTIQLSIFWTIYQNTTVNLAFIAIVVWALWGLGIYFIGIRQCCLYYRLFGTCVIIMPWLFLKKAIIYRDQEAFMLLITGGALLLVGLEPYLIRQESSTAQIDKSDAIQ